MEETGTRKRKSRFDSAAAEMPEQKKAAVDINAAALRAAEISKALSSQVEMKILTHLSLYLI